MVGVVKRSVLCSVWDEWMQAGLIESKLTGHVKGFTLDNLE